MESILSHISNGFALFYINATRHRFGEVTKNAADLSHHESLKDAHVHETTVCVTFGARLVHTPQAQELESINFQYSSWNHQFRTSEMAQMHRELHELKSVNFQYIFLIVVRLSLFDPQTFLFLIQFLIEYFD